MEKLRMKKSLTNKAKLHQNLELWQEIPENKQDKISGGMFDAFTKVVSQADAR